MSASKALKVNDAHTIKVGDVLSTFTRDGMRIKQNYYKVLDVARNKVTVAFMYWGGQGLTCKLSDPETHVVRRSTDDAEFEQQGYFVSVREDGAGQARATQRKWVSDSVWGGHYEDCEVNEAV